MCSCLPQHLREGPLHNQLVMGNLYPSAPFNSHECKQSKYLTLSKTQVTLFNTFKKMQSIHISKRTDMDWQYISPAMNIA